MKFTLEGHHEEFEVELTEISGGSARARINGDEEIIAVIERVGGGQIVRIGRRARRVFSTRWRHSILVADGPGQFEFVQIDERSARRAHGLVTPEITAPMPGKVVKVPVREGQRVEAGEVLVVLEAMKMETALHAESAAVVKQIQAAVGQMVDHGAVLVVLSPVPARLPGEAASPAP
jgi:acetyl/propionyl-CoA carboxylase alpha subunit